ncbi:MAG: DUF3108 domain-containing protein [Betaproteobacteria bacterium]
MAAEGGLRMHRGWSEARGSFGPRKALAWASAVVVVVWLHALALQGLVSALPGLASELASAQATRAFITRTVRIDNAAPKPLAKPLPAAPRAEPPVGPSPGPAGLDAPTLAHEPGDAPRTSRPEPTAPEPVAPIEALAGNAPAASAASDPDTVTQVDAAVAESAEKPAAPPLPVYDYAVPGSTRLKYDVSGLVKGFKYYVSGELLWLQDGKTYDARLEISHFLLGSRVQTSKGALTSQGLEPLRFGDKVRSEVAAHFQRAKGLVTFSANSPDVPLLPWAQDQLSVFVQLAAMWGGNASRFVPGMQLPFQAVGPRSAENWVFVVGESERLKVDGRELSSIKLLRERSLDYDVRVELWLAPALDYLPARIRLTQSNGDEVDMLWRKTEKP